MLLKLFRVTREDKIDWDEFDEFVVAAHSASEARLVHPWGKSRMRVWDPHEGWLMQLHDGRTEQCYSHGWTQNVSELKVECVGTASDNLKNGDVICKSFNAG